MTSPIPLEALTTCKICNKLIRPEVVREPLSWSGMCFQCAWRARPQPNLIVCVWEE